MIGFVLVADRPNIIVGPSFCIHNALALTNESQISCSTTLADRTIRGSLYADRDEGNWHEWLMRLELAVAFACLDFDPH